MQTIVTDVRGVCLSVSLSVMNDSGSVSLSAAVSCAWGHSVQPLSNAIGLLFCHSLVHLYV